MKSKPLGKGLQALFEESAPADYLDSGKRLREIPPGDILPNPLQPREKMDAEQLDSLKDSIKKAGLIQPIAVRRKGGKFEIVAGERRWRAVRDLNLPTIPAYVLDIKNDQHLLEISLLENLKRENLNPIEIALGYKKLADEFSMTQNEISEAFSVDRSSVANVMRLLKLPEDIQDYVKNGNLSMGHARALLSLPTEQDQRTAAQRVLKENLNVRQTEALVTRPKPAKKIKSAGPAPAKNPEIAHLEDRLRYALGSRVRIKLSKNGGKIEVDFYSMEDLDRLIELFSLIEKNIDFETKNK